MSDLVTFYASALIAGSSVGVVVRWLSFLTRPLHNKGGE